MIMFVCIVLYCILSVPPSTKVVPFELRNCLDDRSHYSMSSILSHSSIHLTFIYSSHIHPSILNSSIHLKLIHSSSTHPFISLSSIHLPFIHPSHFHSLIPTHSCPNQFIFRFICELINSKFHPPSDLFLLFSIFPSNAPFMILMNLA